MPLIQETNMNIKLAKEEMNVNGYTYLGPLLDEGQVRRYKDELLARKRQDIEEWGQDNLLKLNDFEAMRDLARFGGVFFDLLALPELNTFVDSVLNEKAVVYSYNGVITNPAVKSPDNLGFRFHRDQPWFKDTRTSIIVMIPLVDYSEANGSTEFVPTTHLFEKLPSDEFMEKHHIATRGRAGEAYCIDACLWHRAGKNESAQVRPLIAIKYHLAPWKQQINYLESAASHLDCASDLVRQRLGWNVRVCDSYAEFRQPGNVRKFKSGQYDMTNTRIHG
jgi:ectoine hydroxylase-related dioxygenase (phytanoyl-CoA dioxygenase family)